MLLCLRMTEAACQRCLRLPWIATVLEHVASQPKLMLSDYCAPALWTLPASGADFQPGRAAVQVDDGGSMSVLPQLIDDYCPDLDHLPAFVLSMAQDVDWEDEQSCFHDLAQVVCNTRRGVCQVACSAGGCC